MDRREFLKKAGYAPICASLVTPLALVKWRVPEAFPVYENFDVLLAKTLNEYRASLTENIFRDNAFLSEVKRRGLSS